MGAHCREHRRRRRASPSRVWAPNARRVSVVGDFNDWDGRRHPMRLRHGAGVWEIFVPGLGAGPLLQIRDRRPRRRAAAAQGRSLCGLRRAAAGAPPRVVAAPPRYEWRDGAWLDERWRRQRPRRADLGLRGASRLVAARPEEGDRFLTYRELAEQLVPYVRDMGFTHIELMPITEHPFDGSWGYQPIGLFAPTSRFGTPDDFRAFVDACHAAGHRRDRSTGCPAISRPTRTASRASTARRSTSTPIRARASSRDWNTYIFNFGRREVANFLLASALLLARRVPHRRAARRRGRLDALPRLQPPGGRVDPQRATAAARTSRRSPSCAGSTSWSFGSGPAP